MRPDFGKYSDGLVPAVIQDADTGNVLMLGYMNDEAFELTLTSQRVTFFSRSRNQLWLKGETSGNFLEVVWVAADCDNDCLLIKTRPKGPVCHTGAATCFSDTNVGPETAVDALKQLEAVIESRRLDKPDGSYVASLFAKGINKIAQKVGEEAVELVIEAIADDVPKFRSEAADLLFHYLILLRAKGVSIDDIVAELDSRKK